MASFALVAAGCGGGSSTPTTYAISGTVTGAVSSGVTMSLSGASTASTATAAGGSYSFAGLGNGSYTVTPSLAGYSFAPTSLPVTVSGASVTAQNFTATALTYSISGTVSGAALLGVAINVSGVTSAATTTDAGGNFTVSGLVSGAYSVAPVLAGYSFSPISRLATVSGANVAGVNFVASVVVGPTYAISGAVSGAVLPGVTITLGGDASGAAATDASGNYSFPGLANGSYTVTPTRAGYSFAPASLPVTVAGADVTAQNFTATALTYSLSGAVSGAVLPGVTITLGGASSASTTTDASGNYSFAGLTNGSYTVTPSLAGYSFTPGSLSPTVNGANVTGQSFVAALQAIYAISGTVSGTIASGVTVTLSGAASASTTTGASGTYSFGSLTNGSYTVTPSLSHYGFTPVNRIVTVSGANQTAQNFTSAAAATYTLSGTVTGPWVENVLVSLGGAATATTRTSAIGAYSFQGLYSGSYTVTPALAGYSYSPSGPSVVIGSSPVTQNFTATSSTPAISISGTVAYGGSRTGPIYVSVVWQNCSGCSPAASTTLSAPGAFTLRGLRNGTYQVVAWRDFIGHGVQNASDPTGGTGTLNVTSDVTGLALTLTDPAAPAAQTPGGLAVLPGNGGTVMFWNPVYDGNGVESATGYKIYWGTDLAASNRTPVTVPAQDNAVYFQTSLPAGGPYYYKIASLVGLVESTASAVAGPVTIGAIAGANVLTGTVTFPATATGPLIVGAFDESTGTMRSTAIASPTSPQAFTVTGIPSGSSYFVFAILDQNNNGIIDAGDLDNTNRAGSVAITGATTHDIILSGAAADVAMTTEHQFEQGVSGSDYYAIRANAEGHTKLPIAATMYSGSGVAVPVDLGKSYSFQSNGDWGPTRPTAGDVYGFKIWYSDGTSELKLATLTTVLDSFARSLSVTASPSATIPTFHWLAPTSPPAGYTFNLSLYGSNANWYYPQRADMPSTQLSVQYDIDGSASSSSLVPGTTYNWSIIVRDPNDNRATVFATYTP